MAKTTTNRGYRTQMDSLFFLKGGVHLSAVNTRCRTAGASTPTSELQAGKVFSLSYAAPFTVAKTTTNRGYRTQMDSPFKVLDIVATQALHHLADPVDRVRRDQ